MSTNSFFPRDLRNFSSSKQKVTKMLVAILAMFMKPFNASKYAGVNFYQIVGLDTSASQAEIKKSYNRFLKQKKNFVNPSQTTLDIWEKTEEAYAILGNNYSRALYDLFGMDFLDSTDFQVAGYQSDEAIEALVKMIGKYPEELTNYGGMVFYPVEFTLEDFMFGAKRNVTAVHTVDCECPDGTVACTKCQKQPVMEVIEKTEITLPKGAYEYHRIIGRGLGDAVSLRAASDIIFVATSTKHDRFERKGRDLYTTVNVSLSQVIREDDKIIKGLDGTDIKIPLKNIQNLMEMRISGQGLPDYFNKNQRGDLIVKFNLMIPETLTDNEKQELQNLLPTDEASYL